MFVVHGTKKLRDRSRGQRPSLSTRTRRPRRAPDRARQRPTRRPLDSRRAPQCDSSPPGPARRARRRSRTGCGQQPRPAGASAALADCYCAAGRVADAGALLDADAADGFAAFPSDLFLTSAMTLYANVTATVGDQRAAATLVDLLEPYRDQVAMTGVTVSGSLAHPLGQVLATIGRYDDADDAFAQAAALHERMGAPILIAETRLAWAHLLYDRDHHGDRARAGTLAHVAHTVAAELGANSIERGARKLLPSLENERNRSAS